MRYPLRGNDPRPMKGRSGTRGRNTTMKRLLLAFAATAALTTGAWAANIGVSMALFDDNSPTALRNGMQDYAKTLPDVNLQVEDATNDVGKQLNQIQNFIASKVD